MQKKNPKTRCVRRASVKSKQICRLYNSIQSAYLTVLEADDDVVDVQCNVFLDGLEVGEYTSDFLCKKSDGTYMIRETVKRNQLLWPSVTSLLDISREYWRKHGVEDWGIVIDKEATDE